jgi:hypothetical protein
MHSILVVTKPFGRFARGDLIEDAARIEQILNGEQRRFVVQVAVGSGARG